MIFIFVWLQTFVNHIDFCKHLIADFGVAEIARHEFGGQSKIRGVEIDGLENGRPVARVEIDRHLLWTSDGKKSVFFQRNFFNVSNIILTFSINVSQ